MQFSHARAGDVRVTHFVWSVFGEVEGSFSGASSQSLRKDSRSPAHWLDGQHFRREGVLGVGIVARESCRIFMHGPTHSLVKTCTMLH